MKVLKGNGLATEQNDVPMGHLRTPTSGPARKRARNGLRNGLKRERRKGGVGTRLELPRP